MEMEASNTYLYRLEVLKSSPKCMCYDSFAFQTPVSCFCILQLGSRIIILYALVERTLTILIYNKSTIVPTEQTPLHLGKGEQS